MIKYGKTLTILTFAGGALGLIGGFFGAFHPAGDSLAVFRIYALLGLFFAMFGFALWRQKFMTYLSLGLVLFGGYSLRQHFLSAAPVAGFTLMQHNTRFQNDAQQLVEYARATAPDIITLQEVTTRAVPQLAALRSDYPYQVICPFSTVGGVAILSKYRFIGEQGAGCLEGQGVVSVRIKMPAGEITVVSMHLHWPWPYGQAAHVERILPVLQALKGPVFMGGDFNMVPWSHTMGQIESATQTRALAGFRFTKAMFSEFVQLQIDHILAPANWPSSAKTGPRLGSDHNSVIASFALN